MGRAKSGGAPFERGVKTVHAISRSALLATPSCVSHKARTLSGAHAEWLRKRIRSFPFTLRKLTAELAERGAKTDVRAVWTFVHAEDLSLKKTMRAAKQDRPRRRP